MCKLKKVYDIGVLSEPSIKISAVTLDYQQCYLEIIFFNCWAKLLSISTVNQFFDPILKKVETSKKFPNG